MTDPIISSDVEVEETAEGVRYVPIIRFGVAYHESARARAFAAAATRILAGVLAVRRDALARGDRKG